MCRPPEEDLTVRSRSDLHLPRNPGSPRPLTTALMFVWIFRVSGAMNPRGLRNWQMEAPEQEWRGESQTCFATDPGQLTHLPLGQDSLACETGRFSKATDQLT